MLQRLPRFKIFWYCAWLNHCFGWIENWHRNTLKRVRLHHPPFATNFHLAGITQHGSDADIDPQRHVSSRRTRIGLLIVWSSQSLLSIDSLDISFPLNSSKNISPSNTFFPVAFCYKKFALFLQLYLPSMTALTRHHVHPQSFGVPSTRDGHLIGALGRGVHRFGVGVSTSRSGLCLRKCRSFRGKDCEGRNRGNSRLKEVTKKESEFWKFWRSGVLGKFNLVLGSDVDREKLMANMEGLISSAALQIGRYIVTMMSTGVVLAVGFQLSGGDSQMNTLIWYSWLGGVIIGTMIGANMVLEEHCRAGPRNVVITGSTRGLGKALAREFLLSGDRVVVASRSPESVQETLRELEENLNGLMLRNGSSNTSLSHAKVVGTTCNVRDPEDVHNLAKFALDELGSIDIWINNAGTNKGFRPLLQFTDEDIIQILSTNLVGSLLCTREAMRVMRNQAKGGHIFNMDGAGSGGSSTPLTAVYGSTKCGLRQLQSSLLKECRRSNVGVHTASPGMVLTDLLLSGSTVRNKQMFNIICELPETVARTLVPRMRVVKGTGRAINYLTPPRILLALVTAWLRRGRWFDEQGRALYAAEADRICNWAENRTRFSFTDAMEMYTENTWVSVFSLSIVCAFIILSTTTNNTFPGT